MIFRKLLFLISHEIRTDFRRKTELFGILLYGFSLLFLVGYSAQSVKDTKTAMILFWMVVVFSCLFASRKSFSGLNSGSSATIFTYYHPLEFYLSRWIYAWGINFFTAMLFSVFFAVWFRIDFFSLSDGLLFLFSGTTAMHTVLFLSASFGMMHEKSATLSLLTGIPLIIPVMMATLKAGFYLADGTFGVFGGNLISMLWAITGISFALSLVLFPYLWKP